MTYDPETEPLNEPEPAPEEQTFEGDVADLLRIAYKVGRSLPPKHPLRKALLDQCDWVGEWYETDDPQQNGWVDSKGRP